MNQPPVDSRARADSRTRADSKLRPIKITVIGDGNVGKTCLLLSYTVNKFPEEHEPTVFENHPKDVIIDGVEFSLMLWDTAGQEEYEKLRLLSYPKTDCFIICYAINNRSSFQNIRKKWIGELKAYCPRASIILVGTKSDLKGQGDIISEKEGKNEKSKIKANHFLQCSAKTREGLDEVFIEAVRAVMKQKKCKNKSFCIYL